jgi:hypothetical protein
MSRGLGRVERGVLADLVKRTEDYAKRYPERSDWPDWPRSPVRLDVIADGTGFHPESVRRALKTLAGKGRVVVGRDNGWRVWDSPDGPELINFWESITPTAQLSAEYLSTLTQK